MDVAGVCTRVSWRLMVAFGPLLAFASAAVSICSILATCQCTMTITYTRMRGRHAGQTQQAVSSCSSCRMPRTPPLNPFKQLQIVGSMKHCTQAQY